MGLEEAVHCGSRIEDLAGCKAVVHKCHGREKKGKSTKITNKGINLLEEETDQ